MKEGDRIGREGQGEEVLVQLAGVPADALAVPAPFQPQRDRGRHHGRLSRFRLRGIYAIDSTTILLLTHLVLRWLKYRSGAACSYSRFAALVRAIVWLKKDAMAILRSYGIAPPSDPGGVASGMPYLPGFEKMFLKSVG